MINERDMLEIILIKFSLKEDEKELVEKWVSHDGSPEEETVDELYLHQPLPVAPERKRLLVTLKLPKFIDCE